MDTNITLPPLPDRIQQVTDELSLAMRWDSACILVLIYRSELIRNLVANALEHFAAREGKAIQEIRASRRNFDIPVILRDSAHQTGVVYSISGLQWGGGRGAANTFHALNMHREYLVEGSCRCLFWTTPAEHKKMVRYSPDFWAFRHKVVDFTDLPSQADINHRSEVQPDEIEHATRLLKLDQFNLDAHQELAAAYQSLGCFEDAIHQYRKILRLTQEKSQPLSSLADIYQLLGQDELSARMRKKAARAIAKPIEKDGSGTA